MRWLWNQPFLRACALLIAGSNFIFQAVFLVVIVLAKARGASPAEIGIILGFVGGGGLLGAFVAPWVQRHVRAKILVIGVNFLWAAVLPLMVLPLRPIVLGPIFALMAFAGPSWNVVLETYELTLTPDRLLGRVQSVIMLLAWGTIPLGSLIAGFLLQSIGPVATLWVMTGLMAAIAASALATPSVRHAPPLASAAAAPDR